MAITVIKTLPSAKLAEFKRLFYSKDELEQAAAASAVKDSAFLDDLRRRLAAHDLDSDKTRFSGSYTTDESGAACLRLNVRCRQPSMIYRFLFMQDYITVPMTIHCSETPTSTVLRLEPPGRGFFVLGCLVTVVLFAAFILPGLAWLYATRSARSAWKLVQEQVVWAALEDRLSGGSK